MLYNFRLRTPKRTPKGVKRPWVTSGSPVTTTKEKKRGKRPGMRRTYSRSGPLPDRAPSGHVTWSLPVKRAIWRNFRLRMHRTYFRTWSFPVTSGHVTSDHVTSGHVTSGSTPHSTPANANWAVLIYYWHSWLWSAYDVTSVVFAVLLWRRVKKACMTLRYINYKKLVYSDIPDFGVLMTLHSLYLWFCYDVE